MELFLVKKNISIDTHVLGVFSDRDLAMKACQEDHDQDDQSDNTVISYLLEKYNLNTPISASEKVRYAMDNKPREDSSSQKIINRRPEDIEFNHKDNIENL